MLALSLLLSTTALAGEAVPQTVEFNRDVRPILSDVCFHCHGPDKAKRKGDLRLDREDDARKVFDAKKPQNSELLRRITTKDSEKRMPPDDSGRKLTDRQIDLLRRWIEQGAKWQKHWAFLPPKPPALPASKKLEWARNPIDAFVLAKLETEGLSPSAEAAKTTLIRRATFDLTGLPPTPDEVSAFVKDSSPAAYERVLDRLLKSPRYGERMAWRWLEAARYADTNGYQNDGERFMWRWRDWVIDAYNSNMPFDRFTIEQIAGDMLPSATQDQRIATGFNRNHRGNGEGGVIPEEYAVEYVVDRVDTTATVWLGLTMGCARCHDHKYDPISQREFYQVFAYFNNIPERGKAVKFGNSPPLIKAPTRQQQDQLLQLRKQVESADRRFQSLQAEIAGKQAEWEKSSQLAALKQVWFPDRHLLARFALDEVQPKTIQVLDGSPSHAVGRIQKAAQFEGKRFLSCGNVGDFGFDDKFTFSCWIYPQGSRGGAIVSRMLETEHANGYGFHLVDGKLQLNLVVRWLDDSLRVETERKLETDRWHHVAVSYDGSRVSNGVKFYVDGKPEKLCIHLDDLNQSFKNLEPLRIGSGGGAGSRFQGLIDEVRIYSAALLPATIELLAQPESIGELLTVPMEKPHSCSGGQAPCLLSRTAPRRPIFARHFRKASPCGKKWRQRKRVFQPSWSWKKCRLLASLTFSFVESTTSREPKFRRVFRQRFRRCRPKLQIIGWDSALVGERGESSYGPGHGESNVATSLWHWSGEDRGGFRFAGRNAQPSRIAGLACHRIDPYRLGHQGNAQADHDERHVSASE